MNMEKAEMFDKALDMLLGDMDDMEGKNAMSHSAEECPDPLGCDMHDGEMSKHMTPDGGEPMLKVEVHKMGMPSMDGKTDDKHAEDGLSPAEAEELKKLLK